MQFGTEVRDIGCALFAGFDDEIPALVQFCFEVPVAVLALDSDFHGSPSFWAICPFVIGSREPRIRFVTISPL